MARADELVEDAEILVRGRVMKVFAAEGLVEVTFAPWWPRWSAVLVKLEQVELALGRRAAL